MPTVRHTFSRFYELGAKLHRSDRFFKQVSRLAPSTPSEAPAAAAERSP